MTTLRFMRRGKLVELEREGQKFVSVDEKQRFLSKIRIENGCWIWTDSKQQDGYGKFTASGGATERSHRAAWRLFRGAIPQSMQCLHKCDTPLCVNPDHLFLGTQSENMKDMVSKNRLGGRAGIDRSTAAIIKRELAAGRQPMDIARSLGVSRWAVYAIRQNKAWRGVAPAA